jgi:Cys-rich repeat protein
MKLSGRFFLVSMILVAAAGCSSKSRDLGCDTDADCPAGQQCIDEICVPQTLCDSDSDCQAPTPRCDNASGLCVECIADGDCGDGEKCVDNSCRSGCTSDSDCTAPTPYCDTANSACVECLEDANCPSGTECVGGSCQQKPQCSSDDECDPGKICVEGTCETGCRSNRDCPSGWECLTDVGDNGTCAQCVEDANCPPGYRCTDHECEFYCTQDSHCAPEVCDTATGTCVECTEDGDCAAGFICRDNTCLRGCRDDGDCPSGRCDPAQQVCVDCLTSGDCPIGHICVDTVCFPGCSSDRDCPTGLYCAADQGDHGACVECLEDAHCPASHICHNNTCTFSCTSDADCSPPLPVCDTVSGACVECLSKSDCAIGNLCVDQVCVPGCEDDRDCPAGQECQGGQCREVCVPTGEEVCDTVDNDCDGRTDADDPQLVLDPCELTAGVCAGSHHDASQCVGGQWQQCGADQYGPLFGDEICDDLDTNCDGTGDDGLQLDCQADYVCNNGQCEFSGGCTSECAQGDTDCSILDTANIKVCRNIDADPCLEWDREPCPPYSSCLWPLNTCSCDYESCTDVCCADGFICYQDSCCQPNCPARTCGSDGCGGTCECDLPNDQCQNGVCVCSPSCAGKECGDDGCGGSCPDTCGSLEHCEDYQCVCDYVDCLGTCCPDGDVCNLGTGQCCTPQCSGKECGPDGCGHTCGSCLSNEVCQDGTCVCVPDCAGKECGDDGCGGSCPDTCSFGQVCHDYQCCTPQCPGECGDDGCGGSCGSCGTNESCNEFGWCECAYEECGGTCCPAGDKCYQDACCTPACGGGLFEPYYCDADGCGGVCDCTEIYGPPAVCNTDLVCECPPPAFQCNSLAFGKQCCYESQTCDTLFGCW